MRALNANVALSLGLIIRLCLVAVSEYADAKLPKGQPGYTDVDFKVFTRAAQHIANGGSPYKESEYRYAPLFALVMLPSVLWRGWLGKVLFCVADVGVACLLHAIFRIRARTEEASYEKSLTGFLNGAYGFAVSKLGRLQAQIAGKRNLRERAGGHLEPEKINLVWAAWLFNPVVIAVSTRGNADSLVALPVLAALLFLLKGRPTPAAVALGAAIHLKLYPVIYVLPAVLFVDHNAVDRKAAEEEAAAPAAAPDAAAPTPPARRRGRPSKRGAAAAGTPSPSPSRQASVGRSPTRSAAKKAAAAVAASASPKRGRPSASRPAPAEPAPAPEPAAAPAAPLVPADVRRLLSASFLRAQLTPARVAFLATVAAAAALPTLASYLAYGRGAVDAAYLYHFGRMDSHHNFSPFWFYVRAVETRRLAPLPYVGLLAFLPQAFAVLAVGLALHRDPPAALFYQTFFFVALNKVVTVQYFVWYLALLPLALAGNAERLRWQGAGKIAVWAAFLALWLAAAYQLEFRKAGNHAHVFFLSAMFLANNLYIATDLLSKQRETSIAWPASHGRKN